MSDFCNVCGRPTHGRYVLYERLNDASPRGLVVCQTCDTQAPRCTICQVPSYSLAGQPALCPTCAMTAPHCASCGTALRGRAVWNQSNGAYYCERCFARQPRCGVCGGAVGRNGHHLHDGRFICVRCHETAIYDAPRAHALYERVVRLNEQHLGLTLAPHPAFVLVDRIQMLALLNQTQLAKTDRPDLVFGLFTRQGQRRRIHIESGLPQILMIQVLAHEYAHAWQDENSPYLRDPLLREGFAEWVAHRVLLALGATKKAALMEQRNDLYGRGLHRMLTLERQGGAAAVFDACRLSGRQRA